MRGYVIEDRYKGARAAFSNDGSHVSRRSTDVEKRERLDRIVDGFAQKRAQNRMPAEIPVQTDEVREASARLFGRESVEDFGLDDAWSEGGNHVCNDGIEA